MVKKIVCVVALVVGVSLFTDRVATGKVTGGKIDAHTLLMELGAMVRKVPETKGDCQALLRQIATWQKKKDKQLQGQSVSPKYGFECQWVAQEYKDSKACTQVLPSKEKEPVEGEWSLKMVMDLVGSDEQKSKGEAWVDMLNNPPQGVHMPLDLNGRIVTASVYAPLGSEGEEKRPNGFQVFVKDKNYKNLYGQWYNVTEEKWIEISLKVSRFAPRGGWIDPGFDPTQVTAVGVKMGAGGNSKAEYKGPVFIDAVNW